MIYKSDEWAYDSVTWDLRVSELVERDGTSKGIFVHTKYRSPRVSQTSQTASKTYNMANLW